MQARAGLARWSVMDPAADGKLARDRSIETAQVLWRHRRIVAAALVLSIVGFVVMTYRVLPPRQLERRDHRLGSAWSLLLVDSARSQAVDYGAAGGGIAALAYRAELLAALVMKPAATTAIAGRLGIDPRLVVADPPLAAAEPAGASVDASDPRAHVVQAQVRELNGGENPVIEIVTRAPTPVAAGRVADAAIAVLRGRLEDVARAQRTPPARRLALVQLLPAQRRWTNTGTGIVVNAAAALLGFAAACWLLVAVARIARSLRQPLRAQGQQGTA